MNKIFRPLIFAILPLIIVICLAGGCSNQYFKQPEGEEVFKPEGNLLMKMGVISDSQIREPAAASGNMTNSSLHFERALKFLKEQNTDAVLMAGDIVDYAKQVAYDEYNRILNSVFPDINSKPEIIYSPGNHEFFVTEPGKTHPDYDFALRLFQNNTGSAADSYTYVNGFLVISISLSTYEDCKSPESSLEFLRRSLEDAFSKNKDIPIFVASHVPVANTVFGSYGPNASHESGKLLNILKNYPNVIYFSGHTHYPLLNERSIFQTSFTMVNTGTLSYTCVDAKNMAGIALNNVADNLVPHSVSGLETLHRETAFGIIAEVYKNGTFLKRIDFNSGRQIGKVWKIPSNASAGQLYYTSDRKNNEIPPQFADNAVMEVTKNFGSIDILFDGAENDSCIESYKITVKQSGTDTEYTACYIGDYFSGADGMKKYSVTVNMPVTNANYEIRIYPYDFFGTTGLPIIKII